MARVAQTLALVACLAACGKKPAQDGDPVAEKPPSVDEVSAGPAEVATRTGDGEALLAKFECHRCHADTGLAEVKRDKHCVRCHQDILADKFEAEPEHLARWKKNIHSLVVVPSLAAVGQRLTREWVRGHLLHPVDVRPNLAATMPRLAIAEAEAEKLAIHLVPEQSSGDRAGEAETAPPQPATIERGRALYRELGCASCHAFTGVAAREPDGRYSTAPGVDRISQPAPSAVWLAPDLVHTRQRFQRHRLATWIASAPASKPDTLMPAFAISEEQARDLAAFVAAAPLASPAAPPAKKPLERPPVLRRDVGYDEVAAKVFRKICWHCHSSPDYARGDGGPGNTGGFGFVPRGLDLSEYSSVAVGSYGPDGKRRSVFAAIESPGGHELIAGAPRLVAHLLARHVEEAGGEVPGIRGMPLGLPALPLEEIQLVDSWIAQGRPR